MRVSLGALGGGLTLPAPPTAHRLARGAGRCQGPACGGLEPHLILAGASWPSCAMWHGGLDGRAGLQARDCGHCRRPQRCGLGSLSWTPTASRAHGAHCTHAVSRCPRPRSGRCSSACLAPQSCLGKGRLRFHAVSQNCDGLSVKQPPKEAVFLPVTGSRPRGTRNKAACHALR